MTNRERAAILKKGSDEFFKESWELQAKANKFSDALRVTQGDIIKEEKLLSPCRWRFNRFSDYLHLDVNGTREDLPKLLDLLKPDYHDNFRLGYQGTGFNLHFDDDTVHLELKRDTAKEMIKALGLIIDWSNLVKRRVRQEKILVELDELIVLMRGMTNESTTS